jgi:hypothetical protein
VETTTVHHIFGRPVTSAGQQKRHPFRSGVLCVWPLGEDCPSLESTKYTCQPLRFTVVSDLPIKRLMRATRDGWSELAAEQGSFAALVQP